MQRLITQTREAIAMIVRVSAAAFALALAGMAMADPPARVARLGYLSGGVTFSPAGENDWVAGTLNRPLITGDRLWANNNARVELQIGSATVRLAASTLFTLTNLDDRIAQMHLQQGTLLLRVRRVDRNQLIEVDTPNLAFVISQPGEYRITVNAAADSTDVITRSGRANVFDGGVSYTVASGRGYRFFGAGLDDYDVLSPSRPDDFDRWAQGRDRGYDTSISARYVSRELIGYQDLDQYGSWSNVPDYGNVWMPTRVASGWSPYSDGHWSWIEPWGWTWVDDQPWGFAVSHYGRWANTSRGWGWVPGPIAARPVYAPALVAFVGGSNFQVSVASSNVGAVGWFPLGPREVYRPAYAVSRDYFTNVNISNTVINNTIIVNNYENRNAPVVGGATYANRAVLGAIVTVPTTAFVQSQPVARAQLQVTEAALTRAPVSTLAALAPQRISVLGAAPQQQQPPQIVERRVVAQSVPPAAAVGFAVKERALVANPGKPLEAAALAALKPAAAAAPASAPPATPARPGSGAAPVVSSPAAPLRVEIAQPLNALGPATVAPPQPPSRGPTERRPSPGDAGQPPVPAPAPAPVPAPAARDPNPIVRPLPAPPTARPAAPMPPAQVPAAPQEQAVPGNRPGDLRGQPAATPPARGNSPAPVAAPPAANMPARPQPAPLAPPPQPVQPVQPIQPAQPVPPIQPARPPAAVPAERAPTEPPRGRRDRPEEAKPTPVTPAAQPSAPPVARPATPPSAPPATPPVAPPATPAVAPPAVRAPEPARVIGPPPKSSPGESKPRVVEEKRDDKRVDKKDEKSDKDKDKDEDEKKRK